jgi:beta-alanine--pyruvate transaminase
LACAAGLAALDLYSREDLFARALQLEPDAVHGLKGLPSVLDIRNAGLSAAIDLGAKPAPPGSEGSTRWIALSKFRPSPAQRWRHAYSNGALIVSEARIGEIVEKTAPAIKAVA